MVKGIYTRSLGSFMFPPEINIASKKILVVFGSTGTQGGSVVNSVLADPVTATEFEVHAITRDPTKPAAAALAQKGAVVLKGDLDDKDSLRVVLINAFAVFAVANFVDHFSAERETQQGRNIADIGKELGVQHFIWSTLPSVSKLTHNTLNRVIQLDSKAIVQKYIHDLGIPATILHLGIPMSCIGCYLQSTSPNSKTYKMPVPAPITTRVPLISTKSSTGVYVKAILQNHAQVLGKEILGAQDWYSFEEIAAVMREEGGLDVVVEQCSEEVYLAGLAARGLSVDFKDDPAQATKWTSEWRLFDKKKRDIDTGYKLLGEPLETFREWVKAGGLDEFK